MLLTSQIWSCRVLCDLWKEVWGEVWCWGRGGEPQGSGGVRWWQKTLGGLHQLVVRGQRSGLMIPLLRSIGKCQAGRDPGCEVGCGN